MTPSAAMTSAYIQSSVVQRPQNKAELRESGSKQKEIMMHSFQYQPSHYPKTDISDLRVFNRPARKTQQVKTRTRRGLFLTTIRGNLSNDNVSVEAPVVNYNCC